MSCPDDDRFGGPWEYTAGGSGGGGCYKVVKGYAGRLSFSTCALDICEPLGGTLATVLDSETSAFISDLTEKNNVYCAYIGLFRTRGGKNHKWVSGINGTESHYRHWFMQVEDSEPWPRLQYKTYVGL